MNRRGRQIVVDTTVMPLLARGPDGHKLCGAIVVMEDHAATSDGKA